MKSTAAIILLGFISLSLFGFMGMLEPASAHATTNCLASLAQNGACPPPEHTVASALFHTNAMKIFSTTLLVEAMLLLVLSLLLFGFLSSFLQTARQCIRGLVARVSQLISRYRAIRELRFSLVLLEHSPTSL